MGSTLKEKLELFTGEEIKSLLSKLGLRYLWKAGLKAAIPGQNDQRLYRLQDIEEALEQHCEFKRGPKPSKKERGNKK